MIFGVSPYPERYRGGRGMQGKSSKRRSSAWAGLGTALLCLCGCTTVREYIRNGFKVGPNYKRPPAPVAQHWIDAEDVRVRSEEADHSQWWTVFNDPVLSDLVGT